MPSCSTRLLLATTAAACLAFSQERPAATQLGHSHLGPSYDFGPREKPWAMDGIGKTHFPISCKPESQQWFDQGNSLLHSFWDYEAERSFRWVIKLDPDCAMGYWGLARVTDHNGDKDRRAAAMKEAVKRKYKVTERERMYIEAWDERYHDDPTEKITEEEREKRFKKRLEDICWKYPDDMEGLSMYALANLYDGNRIGTQALLNRILEKDPRHPGANHYIIHEWIGPDAERALDASAIYGDIAYKIGHAQHMPGHIYSNVGMWREAAISMDKATRVEATYMRDRMVFPFNDWNWQHNRNYLSYIEEQLGMYDLAIQGARQILAQPFDPKYNPEKGGNFQGKVALLRAQIRYERWKDILDPENVKFNDEPIDRSLKSHAAALAHIGLHQIAEAEEDARTHAAVKADLEKNERQKWFINDFETEEAEIKAHLLLAKGDELNGLSTLADAAAKEYKLRQDQNDPPFYGNVIYDSLGYEYLKQKSPALAVQAFEKAQTIVHNDAFALAGLAEAHKNLGDIDKAKDDMGRLQYVWAYADKGLKWMERAKALGIEAEPHDSSPRKQREYDSASLSKYGPLLWEPFAAPKLDVVDVKGKHVSLADYKGKNVLLIFYLGDECPHCLKQLVDLGKRSADFSRHETEVLAISANSPQHNAESLKMGEVPFRLLSDEKLDNAKRFKSYDDFEDLALHSTILVDKKGRVRWARYGGDPFTDFDFLLAEIQRSNEDITRAANVISTGTK